MSKVPPRAAPAQFPYDHRTLAASPRAPRINTVSAPIDPATVPAPIDRTPCFWCGIRADVGCSHTR